MKNDIGMIVVYSSITFAVLSIFILILKIIKHRKILEENEKRIKDMLSELKPGDRIIFLGSMIGTFVRKENKTAIVEISEGVRVEVLLYSINSVLSENI